MKELDFISIQDLFWINWSSNRFSFRWKELPTQVHMSISTGSSSNLINIHLSKNTKSLKKGERKPQLRILEFEKSIADELLEYLTKSIITSIVEKVDINDYSKTKESAVFIISKELENLDDKFIESISQAKTKHDIDTKKRIEVKGKFEDRLSTVINYKPLKEEMMTSFIGFEEAIRNNEIGDGFVMLDEETNLIKVNGYWFKIKIPDNFRELLSTVIGEDLFREIEKLYQFYINSIPNITTFDEGLKISKPIQIIMQNDQNRDSSI